MKKIKYKNITENEISLVKLFGISRKHQGGQVIILGLIFAAILVLFSAAILGYIMTYMKSERQNIAKEQALQLAEAGIDKAAYELNQSSSYTGEDRKSVV